MATIFMRPEARSGYTCTVLERMDQKKILQLEMDFEDVDIGKFAVAIKLNDCSMGHWYFLNPDPSGTIWGHGWDDAKTLSECFTLFDGMDEAENGLEHLKCQRENGVADSAIFQIVKDDTLAGYIELKRV